MATAAPLQAHPRSVRRRTIVRNTVIALVVAAVTLLVEETRFGQIKMDEAFDQLVRHEVEAAARDEAWSKQSLRWSVLALTPDTYDQAPGGPAWTPRRWLVDAMRQAVRGGAKVVFVDFSLPFDVPPYQMAGGTVDEQTEWAAGLAEVVTEASARQVALLFPDLPEPRLPSAFVSTVRAAAAQHRHVRLGSAGFLEDPRDGVVRRIRTYDRDAKGKVRPSLVIQAVLLQAYGLEKGLRQIDAVAQRLSDAVSLRAGFDWPVPGLERPPHFASNEPDEECVSARLRLRLVNEAVLEQFHGASSIETRGDGLVTMYDPGVSPTQAELEHRFEGRVVLVGSTDPRIGDMHRTSVGALPGIYVHANSVDTLQRGLQPLPGKWWNVLAVLVFAMIAGVMFAVLPPMFAMKATMGLVWVCVAWGATKYFQNTGVFINIWAPMAGLVVLEALAEFEHWWHDRSR